MEIKEVVLTKEEYDKGMEKINAYDNLSSQLNIFINLLQDKGIQVEFDNNCSFKTFNTMDMIHTMGDMNGIHTKIVLRYK